MKQYSFIKNLDCKNELTESRTYRKIPFKKIKSLVQKKRYLKNPKYSKQRLKQNTIEDALQYLKDEKEIENLRHGYSFSIPKKLYKRGEGARFVTDPEEARLIQSQYEKAISRTSNYIGNLENHLMMGNGIALKSKYGDYVCGFPRNDVFILSHFAPKTLKSGVEFIKKLSTSSDKIIMAVPDYQANMAVKCGFRIVGKVPQMFNGQMVMKNVCVNNSITQNDIQKLISTI